MQHTANTQNLSNLHCMFVYIKDIKKRIFIAVLPHFCRFADISYFYCFLQRVHCVPLCSIHPLMETLNVICSYLLYNACYYIKCM